MKRLNLVTILLFIPIFIVGASNANQVDNSQSEKNIQPEVDLEPEIIRQILPEYPALAKKDGIEGEVVVRILVGKGGEVNDVALVKSSGHEELDKAAFKAAEKYLFKPAIKDGGPIIYWVKQTIIFNLENMTESHPGERDFVALEVLPEMIYREPPVYPESLGKAGKEGIVFVSAYVDKGGYPAEVKVRKTSGYKEFDDAAVKAGRKNSFKPGIQGGQPVSCWVTYSVIFELNDYK